MNSFLKILTVAVLFHSHQEALSQSWVSRINGSGDYSDRYNVILPDGTGNLILAGSTMNPGVNKDALVVKLDPVTGDTLWTRVYSGYGNGADEILGMVLDNNGFIYVTGFQKGSGTGNDFLTIKLDGNGAIQWTAAYNYPSNEYDQSNSIAVDGVGNVYISGQSDSDTGAITNDDYVTVKYDSNGNQLWADRYNGFGNAIDRPSKILVDASGNAYITGRSSNGFDDDYLTLKYNTSGTLLWSKLYDRLHSDRATDMVLNGAAGVLYITGRSNNGNNYDYVTVKYNTSGVQQWAKVYDFVDDDRATRIALDGNNAIYVTGQSDADASGNFNYDIVTVKYNAAGTQQWVRTFSGAAGNDDEPNAIVADVNGNVWVAGQTDTDASADISLDAVTLHYNAAGTLQWTKLFNGTGNGNDAGAAVAIDASGNAFVAGFSETGLLQRDAVVTRYDNTGNQTWQKFYNGTGDNSDNIHAITVDQADNVYLAGYRVEFGQDRNFTAAKLNSLGDTMWVRSVNGTSPGSTDDALSIATDPSGNVYATGYTKNSGTSSDFTTVKYLPNGDTAWVQFYNYALANESDRAYSLALDNNSNVYVTGRSDQDASFNTNDDFLTIKYSTSGSLLWTVRYNGAANGQDAANTIRVAPSGNVYVAGKTFNGTDNDVCVIKYDAAGQQQWIAFYNSTFGDDEPAEMILDGGENVFICGFSTGSNGFSREMLSIKFTASGSLGWAVAYNGTAGGDDEGKSIALDNNGNILVAGYTDTDTSALTLNNNYCTIQYDAGGNQQWVRFYDGYAGGNDAATGIVTDATGNVFVTGQSDNGTGGIQNYDYTTLKYTSNGNWAGSLIYNGTLNASDVANTLVIKNNNLYIAGGSYGLLTQRDMVSMKVDVTAMGIQSSGKDENLSVQVYPNPSTGSAIVEVPGFPIKEIQVVDVTGRLCAVFHGGLKEDKRSIDCQQLPAGLYQIKITDDYGRQISTGLILEK